MIDNSRSPALLPSERVIVAAPMSLAGSAERAWRLSPYPHGDGWMAAARAATVTGVLLLILAWWAAVLCWYALWGIWLIPYRVIRRGQRRRRADQLRHEELLTAVYRQRERT
jgi:hypothetical protein